VCRAARERGFSNSILMVTALDDAQSVVDGLSLGADDYIGKPFDLDVLEARIKVLLRRNHVRPTMALRFGDLVVEAWQRRLTCDGREIRLTAREFSIMETLMRTQAAISRIDLLEQAWG